MDETLQYDSFSFGAVVSEFPPHLKKTARNLENISKKKLNARFAVLFNEACIQYNLLPRYTNI